MDVRCTIVRGRGNWARLSSVSSPALPGYAGGVCTKYMAILGCGCPGGWTIDTEN